MYIALFLAYWMISCVAVYVYRKRSKGSFVGNNTSVWEHIVIILLSPLALPIIAILMLYGNYKNVYYKNRPKPVPKRMRKYLKRDCVLDERNHTVSLAEYNYKHGTDYSLEDVYGKKYMASLSKEDKADIMDDISNYGKLRIQENIPQTPYTEAAKSLGEALLSGDFSLFENLLDANSQHINYKKETISGKSQVIEYWQGWRSRFVETRKAKKFEVVYSNYYSNACLQLEMMVVLFLIRGNKIQKTLLIQRHLNPMIGYHDDILDFPFDLGSIKPCLSELRAANDIFEPVVTENRIPCLSCGTPSEKLEWHSSLFQFGYIGYSGIVSVCPHCHKVVEYYPEMRSRYNEKVNPKEEKYPIPHKHKNVNYNPKLYGLRNFEGGEPLKGTKYVEGLSGKLKVAAEKSDWGIIHMLGRQDLEKVKSCYLRASEDGIHEAANNLGIIVSNFEGNTEEGIKLFKKAMDGGSHHAMLNMFTILWCDERYQEAIDLLVRIRKNPSPSLKCLWNYAFFLFMGEDYPHNPIKVKSPERAKKILNGILDEQGNPLYNDDKDIFMAIYDFMDYIDNGNILSSKASDFHWRIKTNSDSLVAKGHDVIFNELDALSLDEGLHMSLRFADPKKKGTGFHYYVFNQKDEEYEDILKFLHVRESSMGIWQIYLLLTSPMIAPTGCGVDDERTFILTGDELYDIEPLSYYDLSDLTRQEHLYPSVHIEKGQDGVTGIVKCCYWSYKEGLVKEEIKIHLHNGMVNSYELVGKFVIYKYDGIEF